MSDVLAAYGRGGSDVVVGNGGGGPAIGSGPVERIQIGRPALPCDRCLHAVVCAIKPKLEAAAIEVRAPTSPDPNVKISVSVELTCAFFADDGSPVNTAPTRIVTDLRAKAILGGQAAKTARAAADARANPFVFPSMAAESKPLKGWAARAATRDVEVVEAVRAAGSVTAASIQLGISASRVRQLLDRARARGILPAEVDALVRKRGPKGPRPKLDDEGEI